MTVREVGAALLLCVFADLPAAATPIGGGDWFIGIITVTAFKIAFVYLHIYAD